MQPFTKEVIRIIQNIPSGKVMTYGQVARLAGNPRGARQVARILHSLSKKYQLPWHRVINARGEIVISDHELFTEQKRNLELEGVEVSPEGKVNLHIYQVQN
ncbi:MAG: MGMT family protein [Caldibacillus sp.]